MIDFAIKYALAKADVKAVADASILLVCGVFLSMLSPGGQWLFYYAVERKGWSHFGWVRGRRRWRLLRRALVVVDAEAGHKLPCSTRGGVTEALGISSMPDFAAESPAVRPGMFDSGDPWLFVAQAGSERRYQLEVLGESDPVLAFAIEFQDAVERMVGDPLDLSKG